MSWIIGIGVALVVLAGIVVVVVKASSGGGHSGGGDVVTCPHCNRPTREPPRRRKGAGIELYDFPCEKCGKKIFVKLG